MLDVCWCQHCIFSSTCLIVSALDLLLLQPSGSRRIFLIASFVGIVFFFNAACLSTPPLGNIIWVGTGRVVVIDGVNIGSFLQHVGSYQSQGCRYRCCKYWICSSTHVGSYQSHCIGIGSFIDVAIWLKTNLRIDRFDGIVFFFF